MAVANIQKAHYAKKAFIKNGFELVFDGPAFNEFIVKLNKSVKDVNKALLQKGIIGGYDLGHDFSELENHMLVAVTELRTKEEIDTFVKELGDFHA